MITVKKTRNKGLRKSYLNKAKAVALKRYRSYTREDRGRDSVYIVVEERDAVRFLAANNPRVDGNDRVLELWTVGIRLLFLILIYIVLSVRLLNAPAQIDWNPKREK